MHLVASITGHGFGHVAQTAPVLNMLHARIPDVRLTIRSTAPVELLRARIKMPFEHLRSEGDIGMLMTSSLDVDVARSRAAYRAFHDNWEARVADEARLLTELGATHVLSNVGYLTLAGAQKMGTPNVALCSLNWADIYKHYCGADEIFKQIEACYTGADAFIRTTPGMPMENFTNRVTVGPIAALGQNKSRELHQHLGLEASMRLVLVSLGGISDRLPIERWAHIPNVRWLVQRSWNIDHPDAIVIESLPFDFCDLMASADALLAKPGYGSFTEAACLGIPVLYVARPDWPESPCLVEWLKLHANCREVSRAMLQAGNIADDLNVLWSAPRKPPVNPTGADELADWLFDRYFTGTRLLRVKSQPQ